MFNKLFKRERPRIYLRTLAVAPRSDFKRHIELWDLFQVEDMGTDLHQSLKEIFSLSPAQDVQNPNSNDLGLDVIIPKFQTGGIFEVDLGNIWFPIIWRPKVTVSSRLIYLKSDKTKATFSVTKKMPWRQYLGRIFSWRAFFSFRPAFDGEDMEYLLYQACHKLLLKMKKIV